MKIGMIMACVALLNLGAAHAETIKTRPDFDRVGLAAAESPSTAGNGRLKSAPGENAAPDAAYQTERKREMARRLVWLMLSAR